MSFFDVMKRMMEGKPGFEDEDAHQTAQDQPQSQDQPEAQHSVPQSAIRKGDDSSFPVVYVKRVKTNLSGNKMDVYCQIVNTWPEEIMLDKIRLANTTREIDNFLRGGEEREFLAYSGPRLQKQCFEAQLDYKTKAENDYFEAVHDVKCAYDASDKTYTIDEMRLRRPIRDIYG